MTELLVLWAYKDREGALKNLQQRKHLAHVDFWSVLAAGWSWIGGVRLQAESPLRSLAEPKR